MTPTAARITCEMVHPALSSACEGAGNEAKVSLYNYQPCGIRSLERLLMETAYLQVDLCAEHEESLELYSSHDRVANRGGTVAI